VREQRGVLSLIRGSLSLLFSLILVSLLSLVLTLIRVFSLSCFLSLLSSL